MAAAVRRWPDDLAAELHAEWLAELSCLPPRRRLAFAASLAFSPAVDQSPWAVTFGRAAAVAAGVTLLAGALFNAVQVGGGTGLLILAAAGMALLGRRVRMSPTGTVLLLGAALFGFLFVGNDVPVMPYMGFRDVAPAVAVWTLGMLATVRVAHRGVGVARNAARGNPSGVARDPVASRAAAAVAGGLLTLTAAVAAGNWQGATALGVGTGSAPGWFVLALLPGGTVDLGPHPAGSLLLGNAAASAGPMLLCTIFALAVALGERQRTDTATATPDANATASATPGYAVADGTTERPGPRIAVGVVAALGGLTFAEVIWRTTPAAETVLHRLLDNSAAFGFGFLAYPAGRAGLALLAALLAVRALDARATTAR